MPDTLTAQDQSIIERDRRWRDALLRGWEAEEEFSAEFRPILTKRLEAKYKSSPAMYRMVEEAVGVTLAKMLNRGGGTALKSWSDDKPLLAYLTTIASNQVLEWNKKMRAIPEGDLSADDNDKEPAGLAVSAGHLHGEAISDRVREVLCRFADTIRQLGESKPRHLIILTLKALGAPQGDAAALWGVDKSQASTELKSVTSQLMQSFGGEQGFIALCDMAATYPEVWCGRHPGQAGSFPDLTDDEKSALLALCESPGNKAAMKTWEPRLWRDESALGWLKECLNAARRNEPPLEREAKLSGMAGRLKLAVERAARLHKARDFANYLTSTERLMHEAVIVKTGADAGTLWLVNEAAQCLQAVFNPDEPEIIGRMQPLYSGIISWSYKNDHSIRVARSSPESSLAGAEAKHSTDIDRLIGKSTQAMLVVPFHCAGDQRGVFSLVKFKAGAGEFTEEDQDCANALGEMLARTIEQGIKAKLLG